MKIKIKQNEPLPHYVIDIPDTMNLTQLAPGEMFFIPVVEGDQKQQQIEVRVLADKKSLLIGDVIVRLPQLKNIGSGQIAIVRPVEPKAPVENTTSSFLSSPMTGKVLSVNVKNGDLVEAGDLLLVIEAMKMENRIFAEGRGVVQNIQVTKGGRVVAGDALLTLAAKEQ